MYFKRPFEWDRGLLSKYLVPEVLPYLEALMEELGTLKDWDTKGMEECFKGFLERQGITLKFLAQPLRVSLTNRTASPGLFEVMEVLGKEETLTRLQGAVGLAGSGP
jgi:glutamyl-tRNA synthetase